MSLESEPDSKANAGGFVLKALEYLKTIANELIKKYPNKIPVICKVAKDSKLPPLQKKT